MKVNPKIKRRHSMEGALSQSRGDRVTPNPRSATRTARRAPGSGRRSQRHSPPHALFLARQIAMLFAVSLPVTSAVPTTAGNTPEIIIRGDGSYENAIAWQFEAAAAPDYGAFAVRFPEGLESKILAVVLDLTGAAPAGRSPGQNRPIALVASSLERSIPLTAPSLERPIQLAASSLERPIAFAGTGDDRRGSDQSGSGPPTGDVYIWDESDGVPGAVLWTQAAVPLSVETSWPHFTRINVPVDPVVQCEAVLGDAAWAGFWGNWPGSPAGAFVGTDQDGFGPAGMTRIVPDFGFPAGWQDVSVAWGGITALGIGVIVEPCNPEPVLQSTWGAIKRLYLQ